MKDITPIEILNVEEFLQIIKDPKVTLLDVRTPMEYSAGHIDGAINIDIYNPDFIELLDQLQIDKAAPIALYCHSGIRSHQAAQVLPWAGFTGQRYELLGGYEAIQ